MIKPAELLKQTKLLEIRTRRLVDSVISGQYKTAFRGQGMTFSDFREYVAGDDIRHISWALMAKTGTPFIKNRSLCGPKRLHIFRKWRNQ